ncbi:transposable element Tcb1 transposase [Trichonephila clavipes]|nr:transposable element Tcb1 transposase [Trichonephila clavipes]
MWWFSPRMVCHRRPEPGLNVNDISRIHWSQHCVTTQSERPNLRITRLVDHPASNTPMIFPTLKLQQLFILSSKTATELHVQSVTMAGHIYRDVILEQHVHLFWGIMGAEFLFMDDNTRPHRANIVDQCLQSENITRIDWPAYLHDFNPIEHE